MTTTNGLRKFLAKILGINVSGNSPTEVLTKAALETANGGVSLGGGGKIINIIRHDNGKSYYGTFATEEDFITSDEITPDMTVVLEDYSDFLDVAGQDKTYFYFAGKNNDPLSASYGALGFYCGFDDSTVFIDNNGEIFVQKESNNDDGK